MMRSLRLYLSSLFACLICANARAGYTHYFTWHQRPDEATLKACIAEMRQVIEARTNILVGPNGTNDMVVDSTHVDLNGIGDDAHEPFVFPGELGFNFCKTEVKPYDAVVTACLLIAHDHFPTSVLSIDSDGSWSDGDWDEGIKLYTSVLRRHPQNPIAPLWRVLGWRNALPAYIITGVLVAAVILVALRLRRKFRGF